MGENRECLARKIEFYKKLTKKYTFFLESSVG